MAFNTTSFLAGVGTVVVVLSTGFAGGYMVANPNAPAPPNRLQRLAADNQGSKMTAPVTAAAPKPDAVADATAAQPTTAAQPVETPEVKPTVMTEAKADIQPPTTPPPSVTPVQTNAPASRPDVAAVQPVGPDRNAAGRTQANDSRPQDSRSADAKAVDRKRSDARRLAEQQRKQRELEVATVAVRRIIHERPPQEVLVDDDQPEASAPATPHFSLFGQE